MSSQARPSPDSDDEARKQARIEQEAEQVLRRLCEPGAVLAVARDMDSAVVVRQDKKDGASVRTAIVGQEIAQALALRGWINCPDPTSRVARYFVTSSGREAFRALTAQAENRAGGFKEAAAPFKHGQGQTWDLSGNARYMVTESPLIALARRRDKSGEPFLTRALVETGERLREDFELSLLKDVDPADWRPAFDRGAPDMAQAVRDARERVLMALDELGPGLSDVVLRCCCLLEGLETTEKKLGWSARSGKIVLRIALVRLEQHYLRTGGKYRPMIG